MSLIATSTTTAHRAAAPALPTGTWLDHAPLDEPTAGLMQTLLERQRQAFRAQPCSSAQQRRMALQGLERALVAHQNALVQALSDDFGQRSRAESLIGDIMTVVMEIRHARRHVAKWMRPSRRGVELLFRPNTAWVEYQPKGVVGIIAPWNFPIYLALGPLVTALATGNRAMIKMSEFSPRTTRAMRTMLAEAFDTDEVCVLGGEVDAAQAFSALPFDHIVFTGSTAVGRHVMRAAAANLVPVTLELGGKSPTIVSRSASIEHAAARIAHGKSFNCGQICVAPDYAFVPRERMEAFVHAVGERFRAMHPGGSVADPEYSNVVTPRHAARIHHLIDDARSKGARVIACDDGTQGQRIPLHLVLAPSDDMQVMQEEIFGPVLPVIPYDHIDEVIAYVQSHGRPLAMYWFGTDEAECHDIRCRTHAGGMTINDWGWHVFQNDLPFGGIGPSGMGSYHGVEGFHALSHPKSIFRERRWFPMTLLHPPYGNWVQRQVLRLYLGRHG